MLHYTRSVIFSLHFLGFLTSQHHQTHDVSVCGSLQTQMMNDVYTVFQNTSTSEKQSVDRYQVAPSEDWHMHCVFKDLSSVRKIVVGPRLEIHQPAHNLPLLQCTAALYCPRATNKCRWKIFAHCVIRRGDSIPHHAGWWVYALQCTLHSKVYVKKPIGWNQECILRCTVYYSVLHLVGNSLNQS